MIRKCQLLTMLSALTLGSLVSTANATTTVQDLFAVTVPKLKPGVEFNIAALWLQPGASNLNYVILNQELPAQSPSWTEQELNPSYTPAFEVGLRYVPCGCGQDINLDWTHLSSSTSGTTTADNFSFFLGPDYEIGPAGIPIRTATGTAKFKYDVINLDAGQHIAVGSVVDFRFFAGLSTGFLREEVIANYSGNRPGPSFAGPFVTNQDVYSNFTGVGPRLGIHADVNAWNGFGFLGEGAVSALIGSEYSKTSYTSGAQQLVQTYGQTINRQIIEDQRVYQVIPGFDGKLGVNYKHNFNNNSIMTIAAGFQAAIYMNAISQYLPQTLVTPLETGGIFVATMNHTLSNYSVKGPFLSFAFEA